jgi:hypothetical protein
VGTTPAETARARLVCADAGDYGWSVARRRERTGVTLDEALTLLAQEEMDPVKFRPLAHVIGLAYAATDAEWPPERTRGFVQRVCLREMLGDRAEPKVEPAVPPTTPAAAVIPGPTASKDGRGKKRTH